ncbi:MAG: methyltransferase domain-containing protein [Pseudomonadota bacterium]
MNSKINVTTNEIQQLLHVGEGNHLNLGGTAKAPGWKILNIQPGDYVDYVGDLRDLSQFHDNYFDVVYASHVLEHLSFRHHVASSLQGIYRILKDDGRLFISVPDLSVLCRLFLNEGLTKRDRANVMAMIYGGQLDDNDYHYCGFTSEFMLDYLSYTRFKRMFKVDEFNLFQDTSAMRYGGVLISLNIIATK